MSLYEKMVNEAVGATKAVFGVNKANRGGTFKVTDAKPYVDAVNQMKATDGQSKEVIALHVDSVNAHFDIMTGLTDTVRPEDDPFVEHYQTPPILEIMYEEDPAFKASMWKFIDAIAANKALIGREAVRRYGGMYGPTCVVDFAMSVGSVPNVMNQILAKMDIPADHKKTILACKSWGMNTSYGLAGAFRGAVESGKTMAEAEQAEVEMLQFVYREPSAAQSHLMDTHNLGGHGPHTSFDTRKYMAQYKERMRPTIVAAMKAGVHYANITAVPAYCVGDVAHHIAQKFDGFRLYPLDLLAGLGLARIVFCPRTSHALAFCKRLQSGPEITPASIYSANASAWRGNAPFAPASTGWDGLLPPVTAGNPRWRGSGETPMRRRIPSRHSSGACWESYLPASSGCAGSP